MSDEPAAVRTWPGVVGWVLLCVLYVALDVTDVLDGLVLPVPLILALVLARALEGQPAGRRLAAVAAGLCLVLAALAVGLDVSVGDTSARALALGLAVTGALGGFAGSDRVRARLLPPLGLDPASAVHAVVAVATVVTLLAGALAFVELRSAPGEDVPLSPSDPAVALLGDAALALAGVGFLLTRGVRASLARLGLRRLTLRQAGAVLVFAALFHVVVGVLEWVEAVVLPDIHALEERFGYEFVGLPPVVGALLVSLAAGVGEELVFRGALQPRVGLVVTSLLFASAHVQYQLPGIAMIFLVGVALGVLRERTSTTFTVAVHVLYDIGTFVLPR